MHWCEWRADAQVQKRHEGDRVRPFLVLQVNQLQRNALCAECLAQCSEVHAMDAHHEAVVGKVEFGRKAADGVGFLERAPHSLRSLLHVLQAGGHHDEIGQRLRRKGLACGTYLGHCQVDEDFVPPIVVAEPEAGIGVTQALLRCVQLSPG